MGFKTARDRLGLQCLVIVGVKNFRVGTKSRTKINFLPEGNDC